MPKPTHPKPGTPAHRRLHYNVTQSSLPHTKNAYISDNDLYRYVLSRTWAAEFGHLCFLMLNPSRADASLDDPTIRRCMSFAKRAKFGGIVVVNLYAYRASDPVALKHADDPVGPLNDRFILGTVKRTDAVICAWGATPLATQALPPAGLSRVDKVMSLLTLADQGHKLYCLGRTKSGQPRHPLMLHKNTPFEKFEPRKTLVLRM